MANYYRITVYDWNGKKDIITEDSDDDIILEETETCLQDLFKGSLKSIIVSRITGKTGMRDDL
uniref:Uncharacterized protein n=1 Tax=viral metagenome TaxID=1070528 RepID=A0A6M3LCT0_9ZZZZ